MEAETLEGSNKLRSRFSNEGLEIEFCLNKQKKKVIIFHSLAFKSVADYFTSFRKILLKKIDLVKNFVCLIFYSHICK